MFLVAFSSSASQDEQAEPRNKKLGASGFLRTPLL
jgi:hypothetical protein